MTKPIFARNGFGFNILLITKPETIVWGSLVVEEQLHNEPLLLLEKTFFCDISKAQKQHMAA